MAGQSRKALKKQRSAQTVMGPTRSFRPTIRIRRSQNSMSPSRAASVTQKSSRNLREAFTGKDCSAATASPRPVPIVMEFIPSSPTRIQTRRLRSRICHATRVHGVTKESDSLKNSACPAIVFRVTWTAITGSPRKAVPSSPLIAQAAMACTTYCLQAILTPPSIAATSTRLAGNAIKA